MPDTPIDPEEEWFSSWEVMSDDDLARCAVDSRRRGRNGEDIDDGEVWGEVFDRCIVGGAPIRLLDAMLEHAATVEDLAAIGAGEIETVLRRRPECWQEIATRLKDRSGSAWRAATGHAWVPASMIERMPAEIASVVRAID